MEHKSLWSLKNEFDSHNYNMIIWSLINLIIVITISILLASRPLAIGVSILSIAILVALIFALTASSWFAFLIFLIYVGGILVIFSYFVALTPNQPTISSLNYIIGASALLISMAVTKWLAPYSILIQLKIYNIGRIYTVNNSTILVALALILLLIMVVTVKITCRSKGPLRAFMSYV